jgi:flavin-binding protein dodecin
VSRTVRHVEGFEATEIRGQVENGDIKAFQVTLKVGFKLE